MDARKVVLVMARLNSRNGFYWENAFSRRLLNEREWLLMRLLFDRLEHPEKEKAVRYLTEHIDIDTENMNYMLMLSILGFQTNWYCFPAEAIPRLKGIHRYCQAHNVMGMPWLLGKVHTLQNAGIPVMFLKGLALRCYYNKNVPRMMYDYDIAVPRDRFREAMTLLRSGDTVNKGSEEWSDTIVGKCSGINVELDVHQWIFKEMSDQDDAVWKRALAIPFYDTEVLVLSPDDMFLHQLNTHAKNIIVQEMAENRMKWLFDCRSLLEDYPPDPKKLETYTQEYGLGYIIRFMLSLLRNCFGEDPMIPVIKTQVQEREYGIWLKEMWNWGIEMEYTNKNRAECLGHPFRPDNLFHYFRRNYYEYRVEKHWHADKARTRNYLVYLTRSHGIKDLKSLRDYYKSRKALREEYL